ncbi:Asp23/Gls24 family envelope stress response protein [Streptomyces phyllanthi]|uniref:Asp23/Gls24 family envelope stress response protein n=1 Tax=Streptomyces phyllanthi TaxID=1803180 RepID=A0A5N8WA78_9ACTN|nr:Asp23/Gls24 family envelope stress response protein [Streptomyces phyllanthi]
MDDGNHSGGGRPDEGRRPLTTVAPGERGATRIADRVVAKIAAQAAREALKPLPPDAMPPHADAVVHREAAHVRVGLELEYPSDIGARCAAVRRHVAQRVEALAGVDVPEVAVLVERLHLVHVPGAAQRRTR